MSTPARLLLARLSSATAASCTRQSARCFSSEGASTSTSASGSVIGACVLERLPLLVPSTPSWEVEYKAWKQELDLKKGELKEYPKLSKRAQAVAAGLVKQEETAQQTDMDVTPSTTAADASGDVSTMQRQLQQHVYLLVKQNGGWSFPKAAHKQGETIRQTAERALTDAIDSSSPVYFIGNAPMAHLPAAMEGAAAAGASDAAADAAGSTTGSSTFYMLAQVQKDPWPVQLSDGYNACAWVTREELAKYLPADEAALAHRMLL